MKRLNTKSAYSAGYNTIEMLLVMLLLALFGFAIFSLIVSGTQTYARINDTRSNQENARTAISYVEIRLRQNDVEGQIYVTPDAGMGNTALEIRNPFVEDDMRTWIFFHEGTLYECITSYGDPPSLELSLPIVEVDGMSIEAEGNSVRVDVRYSANEEERHMRTRVTLRTPQTGLGGEAL